HWTVSVGRRLDAVNVAVCPMITDCGPGFMVTESTVSVAAAEWKLPPALRNTARYWLPFWFAVVPKTETALSVAPLMSVNVLPPSTLNCHCTVSVARELADVKVADCPSFTDCGLGFVVTRSSVCVCDAAVGDL